MSIKAAMGKLLKGESLNDEEKELLANFDPDKAAAAARKEGSKKVQELETKLAELEEKLAEAGNSGKSEAEKLKSENEKAAKKLAELTEKLNATVAEKAKFIRETKLAGIASKLKTVPGIDAESVKLLLSAKLSAIEDLDDATGVEKALGEFRAANKALLIDESGSGSGTKNDGSNRSGGSGIQTITRAAYDAMPIAERSTFKGIVKE